MSKIDIPVVHNSYINMYKIEIEEEIKELKINNNISEKINLWLLLPCNINLPRFS